MQAGQFDEEAAELLEELLVNTARYNERATKLLPVLFSLRVQVTLLFRSGSTYCGPAIVSTCPLTSMMYMTVSV